MTGESYFEQFDHLNSEHFEQFIHQFAARYAEDAVMIQMDQASAHRAQEVDWSENIISLFQSAYIPEVNPVERFWKHLKTPFPWDIFENLKALRQRVQEVL
ncbi:MAG: transposase [Cyanobacteria bacterium P01_C01_bin.120]